MGVYREVQLTKTQSKSVNRKQSRALKDGEEARIMFRNPGETEAQGTDRARRTMPWGARIVGLGPIYSTDKFLKFAVRAE